MPTDSFFSETFNNSILVRPTFIMWDHSYEKPIQESSEKFKNRQIDCIFNDSECHLNLLEHKQFSWDLFNNNYNPNNVDWLQLDRE